MLADNNIGSSGAEDLCKMLGQNCAISKLDLSSESTELVFVLPSIPPIHWHVLNRSIAHNTAYNWAKCFNGGVLARLSLQTTTNTLNYI